MAFVVAGLKGRGFEVGLACPRARSGIAAEPNAAAVIRPLALRNDRRLLDDLGEAGLFMATSGRC
jgi:hypothetical protein